YMFCSARLIDPLDEAQEIYAAVDSVPWVSGRPVATSKAGKEVAWQAAYNRLFEMEFERIGGWVGQPTICPKPRHKGDFLKNDVRERGHWRTSPP
ncbi:MAG: hypothetical protein QGI33_03330, partial [Candidatus Brocadiia bacterium]|nr:hypothetical protein [Candidatus Brocadiia bacterium]